MTNLESAAIAPQAPGAECSPPMRKNSGNLKVTTPSEREIRMVRHFHAPRRLVYAAYTQPELLKRWFGVFDGWSLDVCEVDLRVDGAYCYLWRRPEGGQIGFRGVYREIVAPERIVCTEEFFEPFHAGESLVTNELVEAEGRTTLTVTALYPSREVRDAVLQSGMEHGVATSYDTLEEILVAMIAGGGR